MFYGSTHEKDNYPGTGPEPRLSPVSVEELQALREEVGNELLSAVCGDLSGPAPLDMPHALGLRIEVAESEEDRRIVNRSILSDSSGSSRRSFRLKWREVIFEMVRFAPELVILSAGFDAHRRDPLASLSLIEEDFEWATKIVMDACRCCGGSRRRGAGATDRLSTRQFPAAVPCVSILEGGYNIEAITESASAHVKVLFREAWAHAQEDALLRAESGYDEERTGVVGSVEGEGGAWSGLGEVEPLEEDSTNEITGLVEDISLLDGIDGDQSGLCNDELEGVHDFTDDTVATATTPLSVEEILASLDMSIDTLMLEALLHLGEENDVRVSDDGDAEAVAGNIDGDGASLPLDIQQQEATDDCAHDRDEL